MTYRASPAPTPLFTCLGGYLVALDPERGTELWSYLLERHPGRVLSVAGLLFLATHTTSETSRLLVFDAHMGALRSDTDLGFEVTTAIATTDRVYFGGADGLVALSVEGALLFRHDRELREKDVWNGHQYDVVVRDGRGVELSRKPESPRPKRQGLLVLGDIVSQPDFDT